MAWHAAADRHGKSAANVTITMESLHEVRQTVAAAGRLGAPGTCGWQAGTCAWLFGRGMPGSEAGRKKATSVSLSNSKEELRLSF